MENFELKLQLNKQEKEDLELALLSWMEDTEEKIKTNRISKERGKSQIKDLTELYYRMKIHTRRV